MTTTRPSLTQGVHTALLPSRKHAFRISRGPEEALQEKEKKAIKPIETELPVICFEGLKRDNCPNVEKIDGYYQCKRKEGCIY